MKLLSIVTVCLNSASTLERTITSVALQKNKIFGVEYLIIDGGSTDGTLEIIKKWTQVGIVDHWLSEPDRGIYDAMNKGNTLASGNYICQLNSDDELEEDILVECAHAATCNPPYFYGDNSVVLPDKRKLFNKLAPARIINETLCCHQALWVRNDVIKEIGGYRTDVGLAADQDFMIRLFDQYRDGLYLDRSLCIFHLGGHSSSTSYSESDRMIRLGHLDTLKSFGRINLCYAETFLNSWSGKILVWAKCNSGNAGNSEYLAILGREIGVPSQASLVGKLLLLLTLTLFSVRGKFGSRHALRCVAMLLHLHSRRVLATIMDSAQATTNSAFDL
jgi:glycosyltransferase involved in cell wall biosynthesis